ncbi:nickel pincer cofactor biosynthesis protein LarC [Haloferacaceae archaeon DSL9]
MHTLAFDGRMGASGDMLLGALLAAGADRSALDPVEAALPIRYAVDTTIKNGIQATTVDVLLDGDADTHVRDGDQPDDERGYGHAQDHDHTHGHDHDHSHGHDHDHSHSHAQGHGHSPDRAEGHGPHRSYAEVVEIVERLDLPAPVVDGAVDVFRLLGEAEATIHGVDLDEIHFHEVGADDAIADIVGACALIHDLGVERIVTTPLATGGGDVSMSHGVYPIPAPAVVEIAAAADWSLRGGPVEAELLTPTGAAILGRFAEGVDALPPLAVDRAGYGAGAKTFESHPNVLRALVGETSGRLTRETITVLETNLDDVSPEILGGLQSSLAEVGARDVSVVPVTMKKSRPGHLVKVIVPPEDAERVAHRLAIETGTLGIREHGAGHRWIATREFESVSLDIDGDTYDVAVKLASTTDGTVYDASPEYDDAAAVAERTGLPVREIVRRAAAAATAPDAASTRATSIADEAPAATDGECER